MKFGQCNTTFTLAKLLELNLALAQLQNRLTLSFAKVRPILEGTRNQGNFRVGFNEAIGALDLIDVRAPKPIVTKKKQRNSHGWLTIGEYQGDIDSDLRALLFNENGILRVEASRMWASGAKEALSRENTTETNSIVYHRH